VRPCASVLAPTTAHGCYRDYGGACSKGAIIDMTEPTQTLCTAKTGSDVLSIERTGRK